MNGETRRVVVHEDFHAKTVERLVFGQPFGFLAIVLRSEVVKEPTYVLLFTIRERPLDGATHHVA